MISIYTLFQNSITIVEESSDESKTATRAHLQQVVNDYYRDSSKPQNLGWKNSGEQLLNVQTFETVVSAIWQILK